MRRTLGPSSGPHSYALIVPYGDGMSRAPGNASGGYGRLAISVSDSLGSRESRGETIVLDFLPLVERPRNMKPDATRAEAVRRVGRFRPTSRPEELVDDISLLKLNTFLENLVLGESHRPVYRPMLV